MGVAAFVEVPRVRPGIELAARLCTARLSVVARELRRHARQSELLSSGVFPRIGNGQSSWKREAAFFWRDGNEKSVAALAAKAIHSGSERHLSDCARRPEWLTL